MAGTNIHSQITDQTEIHVPKGFTEAPNNSGITKNKAGQLEWVDLDSLAEFSNFIATTDPNNLNDSTQGYEIGSRWCNTAQKNMWICVDPAPGQAIWRIVTKNNPSAVVPPTQNDDASKGYKEGSIWIVVQSGLNQIWICSSADVGNAEWQNMNTGVVVGYDHRTLSHLDSDDHLQYLNRSGVRPMTGGLDMGNQTISNALQVNGVKIPDANVLRVKLNPGTAEYSSVAAAVAAITTASSTNPWLVLVGPGQFIEPQIVMKPYVYITGMGFEATIIKAGNPLDHLILACDYSAVQSCVITGVSASGKALVYYSSPTGTPQTSFWLDSVKFGTSDVLVISDGTAGWTNLFIEDCRFGGIHQFNTGFIARSTSLTTPARIVLRNSTSTRMSAPYPVDMFVADGINCEVNLRSVAARTGGVGLGGNGIRIRNGGGTRSDSAIIDGWTEGLFVENIGLTPPQVIIGIVTFVDNTHDIKIDHPGTFGGIAAGANDDIGVSITPTATNIGFIILGLEDGDVVVAGKLKQNQPDATFTDLTTTIANTAPLGLLSSGDINPPLSGFTVGVEAGLGYLQKPDGSLRKVIWPTTPATIPASTTQYLYFDENATLLQSGIMPDPQRYILVGRVVTSSTGILIVDESGFSGHHAPNAIGQALRQGLGPVYATGSIVSEFGTRQLNISPGRYFYGELVYDGAGGSPVTFIAFYQNGTGGYVNLLGQTTVDNAQWDNGTGTLQPISAGQWVKHSIYCLGDSTGDFDSERYFLVYGQQEFSALVLAEQGPLPNPPNFLSESVTLIASVIVQQGSTHFASLLDERPISSSRRVSTVSAATFHSNLLGLTIGDDHPQYWRNDGAHIATGDWNLGNKNINNVNTITAQIVHINNVALGDISTKAANTAYATEMSVVSALIFG